MISPQNIKHKQSLWLCVIYAILLGCTTKAPQSINPEITLKSHHQLSFPSAIFPSKDIHLLKESLPLQVAQARLRQSESLYDMSFSGFYPTLSADIQRSEQKFSPFGFRPNRSDKLTTYQGHLNFRLVPDFFGKTKLQTEIARSELYNAQYNLALTQLQTMNSYVKNYYLVCHLNRVKDITTKTVALNHNILKSIQLRFQQGKATALDFYNTQNTLRTSEINLGKTEQSYQLALKNYDTLLGQDLSTDKKICHKDAFDLTLNNIVIPINYLDARPDIHIARLQTEIQAKHQDLSLKSIYPDASIIFALNDIALKFPEILDAKEIAWNFLTTLTQVVYDGGIRDNQQAIAHEDFKIASLNYRNLVVDAVNSVQLLQNNLLIARDNLKRSQLRLTDAIKALEIAKLHYSIGRIPFIEFMNTERQAYHAQLEHAQTELEIRNLYTDLLTALGIKAIRTE